MDKTVSKKDRKEWRKLVKKLQRKRRRQTSARARDQKLAAEEAALLRDPAHQAWLQQQSELQEHERLVAAQQHDEEEEAWLRRDLLAHRQFRREQQQRAAAEAAQEAIRLQRQQEYEEREAAKRRRQEAAAAEFEQTMQLMEKYLSSDDMQSPPASLCRIVETRPGQKACEFYERTSCCRFGATCVFNHRRPLLSSILVLRHFFVHSALEQQQHHEYASAETALESGERDLREDYDAFFADVVPELEQFGKILNFRTVCNVQKHLRGHVFVEYTKERSALKAFINLQGRYYATRRLNVEFSKLVTWRGAICGLSLTRKCPKGNNCNYLHLFSNPDNKYNTLLEYTKPTPYSLRKGGTPQANIATPTLSWDEAGASNTYDRTRRWRWSESPEVELQTKASSVHKSMNNTDKRNKHKNGSPRRPERHSGEKNRRKRQHSSSPTSRTQHKQNEDRSSHSSGERHYKSNRKGREKYKINSHSKARSNSSSCSEFKSSKQEDRSSKHIGKLKRESSNEISRRRKNRSRSKSLDLSEVENLKHGGFGNSNA